MKKRNLCSFCINILQKKFRSKRIDQLGRAARFEEILLASDNFAKKSIFLFIFSIQCDIINPLKTSKASSKGRKVDKECGSIPRNKEVCGDPGRCGMNGKEGISA